MKHSLKTAPAVAARAAADAVAASSRGTGSFSAKH